MITFSIHRRPQWEHLIKTGLSLQPEHFTVGPRGLDWNFTRHSPSAPAPADMPAHRLRQLYRMRRLEAVPEVMELVGRRGRVMPSSAPVAEVEVPVAADGAEVLTPVTFDSDPIPVPVGEVSVAVSDRGRGGYRSPRQISRRNRS